MNALIRFLAAFCIVLSGTSTMAQNYPNTVIRLVVPIAPGGTTDVVARIIAPALSRNLGQPVIIENKPGAGGVTGTSEVLRSTADGYTLAVCTLSTVAANPAINPATPYGPSDLTAIINIAESATMIAVNPNFPAKTYKDFIAELKSKPSKYSYGSSGMGGISHLQMEQFKSLAGVFVNHIPYRGAAPAILDTVSGQIELVMDATPSILPFINSGKLRPVVVAAPARLKELPDTPTFSEVGLPQMNRSSYFGLIGPKGIPVDIVSKLNAAVRLALEDPAIRQRLEANGASAVGGASDKFASEINESFLQLKKVVELQKLTLGQ